MKTYLDPQCRTLKLTAVALLVGMAMATGCASQGPEVKVLGVTQPRQPMAEQRILVFVEVVNPGSRELQLSRLEYQFQASSWLESKGRVALKRHIAPGASAIVEIPVPVQGLTGNSSNRGVGYTLEGRLFATDDQAERSWSVQAKGALRKAGRQDRAVVRVATVDVSK